MRLLMTRPRAASERFVARIRPETRDRVSVIHSPLLAIRPLPGDIDLDGIRGLIFTSANAVCIASSRIATRDLPCFCVGETTTGAAQSAGWTAQCAGATSEALVAGLLRSRPASPLLHLRGLHTRGDPAAILTGSGLTVRDQAIYDQQLVDFSPEARAALVGDEPVIAPVFSPRSARQFAGTAKITAPLWLVALSDAVAQPLLSLPYQQLKVAKTPSNGAIHKALAKMIAKAARVESARDAL